MIPERVGIIGYGLGNVGSIRNMLRKIGNPTKFNSDKRRAHFSSQIVAGIMTREEALAALERPLYDPVELEIDIDYVTNKLNFNEA